MPEQPIGRTDDAGIKALLSGLLSEAESIKVIEKLPEQAELLTLGPEQSDPLIRTLRLLADRPLEPDPPEIAEVVGVVLARTSAEMATAQHDLTALRDVYPYLSPAEQPNELGRLGEYRILRVLGQGGMGTVFAAEDLRLHRMVALKALRPELCGRPDARQRFLREARAAAAVVHDNVMPIFAVDEANGIPFLVMPIVPGETLQERLAAMNGPLPVPQLLAFGQQIADGLAAAHVCGLIHRDVKPGNVFLAQSRDGSGDVVRILDFGLARVAADDSTLTQSGVIVGTPAYIAPEQAAGETVDVRADLFSLGCVLYHMATGHRPFSGTNNVVVLWQVGQLSPPAPHTLNQNVPGELSRFIMRLMAKEPKYRPPTAVEVAKRLRQLAVARPPRQRVFIAMWLLVMVGLLVITGVIVIKSQPQNGRPTGVQVPEDRAIVVGREGQVTVDLVDGVKMEFVLIPKGKFKMGSPEDEKERNPWEKVFDSEQQHAVEITKPFYLAKYPVTQEQYQALMKDNPSYFQAGKDGADKVEGLDTKQFPVETVSWDEAQAFCKKLLDNDKQMRSFRLPSEAEWEYACRAGTATPFSFGSVLDGKQANCAGFTPYDTENGGPYKARTTKVGEYGENQWGLCDMHGNICQWCEDYYGPYEELPQQDPLRSARYFEERRVLRGGSWDFCAARCRAACRGYNEPIFRAKIVGFRVAFSPETAK